MQRNFEPMRKQVEAWQRSELTDVTAKLVIYETFVEGKLEAPNILPVRYVTCTENRKYEEFRSRTIWSLSNAFTYSESRLLWLVNASGALLCSDGTMYWGALAAPQPQ
jgi:hypothetical protein